MSAPLRTSELFEDYRAAMDAFIEERWSDGLPVVLPTPDLVDAMIAAGGRDANELIGTAPVRDIPLFVWQVATSAVMAGCRPDYFPIVLATWDAMFAPEFNLHAVLSSTSGPAVAGIVSGPYAAKIGMNSSTGLMGPGNRANATIGRAIRIGALTALKAIPAELDYGAFGHPGKYTFHFAEGVPPEGWPTARELQGYPASATTVTVLAADAPRQIAHRWSPTADEFLHTVASNMKDPSQNGAGSDSCFAVVLGPEHAGLLADGGLKPGDIAARLEELTMLTVADLAAAGIRYETAKGHFGALDARGRIRTTAAGKILVFAAGGPGAGWSMVIPCFAGTKITHAATRPVRVPGEPVATRGVAQVEFG